LGHDGRFYQLEAGQRCPFATQSASKQIGGRFTVPSKRQAIT
jgi:hypothetical protein